MSNQRPDDDSQPSTSNIHKFHYSANDLFHDLPVPLGDNQFQLSKFDINLRQAWDQAMSQGYFRYTLGDLQTKILPGPVGYVAQLNIKRAIQRRKPHSFSSVKQPFDNTRFNFNKINSNEILFELCPQHTLVSQQEDDNKKLSSRNLIIINVSPLEYCNVLLTPAVEECLPQAVTASALQLAIEMLLLSSHRGFRLGFNSICAFASINHLHFHAYYINNRLPSENWRGKPIAGPCMELLDSPAKGFGFQYLNGDNLQCLIKNVHKLTSLLYEKEIAHNIFITRGDPFLKDDRSCDNAVRVLVWPRSTSLGAKDDTAFNVAVCELAGHLPIKLADQFQTITEDYTSSLIRDVTLPHSEFSELRKDIANLFSQS